jgi:hypothetical protein
MLLNKDMATIVQAHPRRSIDPAIPGCNAGPSSNIDVIAFKIHQLNTNAGDDTNPHNLLRG